ncbi:Elongation factor 1-alpha [Sesamum angolense]|uniref:Elongation factor 1-alpha n=1 Tax=Sesamum angolense TaxID=2727404 RepID=A0AAE2BYV9_9LAMI|nr:Elongation factor 1-alpha [Sesamum angolense]
MENQNLVANPSEARLSWFKGPSLLDAIDSLQLPERDYSKPLLMPICDVIKSQSQGQVTACGKLESGAIRTGSKVLVMPSGITATARSLERDSHPCNIARAGDNVTVNLQGIEGNQVTAGGVICHPDYPVQVTNRLQLKILVLDISTPIVMGSQLEFHIHHAKEAARIVKMLSLLDPKTGKTTKKSPRCLLAKQNAIVEVVLQGPVCVEEYSSCRALGRVFLRSSGRTIALASPMLRLVIGLGKGNSQVSTMINPAFALESIREIHQTIYVLFIRTLIKELLGMGCLLSTPRDVGGNRGRPARIGDVAVFVPGLRIPKPVDFSQSLGDYLNKNSVEQLSALRTRIVVMAGQEAPTITRTRRRTATQHGGSTLGDLLQALEDYLPVLLGLVKDGNPLQQKVQFVWVNQEDEAEETTMYSAWYEVLSVLHLMATLSLSQANLLLLPRASTDGYQPKLPDELRRNLPVDLAEGVLRALCLQALGQDFGLCILLSSLYELLDHIQGQGRLLLGNTALRICGSMLCVDIQLGLAIDSTKATLAVKRRLACEMVKYWQQAQDNIMNLPLTNCWGEKHRLFLKWKYIEAKAAAYYYHGLILDEGSTEKSHGTAVAALQAADEYLKECKKACESFNSYVPVSRNPPVWGTMKYLSEKIPKDTSSKVQINRDLYSHEKIMERAPTLPDFALALKPDEYQLPLVDASWNEEAINEKYVRRDGKSQSPSRLDSRWSQFHLFD